MSKSTEEEALGKFLESDHYKIAQMAKPILEKLKPYIPQDLSLNDVRYEFIPRGENLKGQITYTFSRKTGVCSNYRVRLHRAFANPLLAEEATETLSHELCHYTAMKWRGYAQGGHGYYWGYLMISLGYEPHRYASQTKAQAVREIQKLENQAPYQMLDCPQCGKEVIAELIDYAYHCPDCGNPIVK